MRAPLLVVTLLAVCGACQRGSGGAMPEPIQPEAAYRLPVQQDGGACDLYFFRAWTGYAHPVQARKK